MHTFVAEVVVNGRSRRTMTYVKQKQKDQATATASQMSAAATTLIQWAQGASIMSWKPLKQSSEKRRSFIVFFAILSFTLLMCVLPGADPRKKRKLAVDGMALLNRTSRLLTDGVQVRELRDKE